MRLYLNSGAPLDDPTHFLKPVGGRTKQGDVHEGVLAEVLSRGADPDRPGGESWWSEDEIAGRIPLLLKHGFDPANQYKDSVPPLVEAAFRQDIPGVMHLLNAGAPIDEVLDNGQTVLEMTLRPPPDLFTGTPRIPRWYRKLHRKAGGSSQRLLRLMFDALRKMGDYGRDVLVRAPPDPGRKLRAVVRWRQAHDAQRDAGMVFHAASEGRSLELAKRLRLGKLAGGLDMRKHTLASDGRPVCATPMEAASLHGHEECMAVLHLIEEELKHPREASVDPGLDSSESDEDSYDEYDSPGYEDDDSIEF